MTTNSRRTSYDALKRNERVIPLGGNRFPDSPVVLANQMRTIRIHVQIALIAVPLMENLPRERRCDCIEFGGKSAPVDVANLWPLVDDPGHLQWLKQEHEAIMLRTIPLQLHELTKSYCRFDGKTADRPKDWQTYCSSPISAVGKLLRDTIGHSALGFIESWPNGLREVISWNGRQWSADSVGQELLLAPADYLAICSDYETLVEERFSGE